LKINIFWFRRDLRLDDNTALNNALGRDLPVLPLFIFDTNITDELADDDPRLNFIYESLAMINNELQKSGSSLRILKGDPVKIWEELMMAYDINAVFVNRDYEPYATRRDNAVEKILGQKGISLFGFKDQVIFEEGEILKSDNRPYTVFTPYKNRWLKKLGEDPQRYCQPGKTPSGNYLPGNYPFPSMEETGLKKSRICVRPYDLSVISCYQKYRDDPAADRTSYLSPHLRFGTVSIRKLIQIDLEGNHVFLNELIWREFFMQILFHFPHVITENFKPIYNNIQWRNNEEEFEKWCRGETGYAIVDAGMRQLIRTGYMHNRIRMITAGFLCKNLLTDWRWGEAWFAEKLLDYELSSNNGNWQWSAGTGCDATPYFRIFNPDTQQKKFDPKYEYVTRWVDDYGKTPHPERIVDHDFARQRALITYREGIKRKMYV